MLLESLDLQNEANAIKNAVNKSLEQEIVTEDLSVDNAYSTSEVGDWIAKNVAN